MDRAARSQQADRAGAGDDDALAHQRAGAVDGMEANRQRFGDRQGEQVGIGRNRDDLIPAQNQRLRKAALNMGEAAGAAQEDHVGAEVHAACAAIVAGEAGAAGVQRRLHARFDMGDGRSDLQHDAGNFMAQRHRFAHREVAHGAAMIIVHVRPANAAIGDADPDLIGGQRRLDTGFHPQILLPMTYRSQHESLL